MENIFKDRLKELRLEKSMSQEKLSTESGISQTAITRWESGERKPSMDCLIMLAKFFGVSIDYLVGLED